MKKIASVIIRNNVTTEMVDQVLAVSSGSFSKVVLQDRYLSYVNDFISLKAFAAYYNYSQSVAESVINRGKVLHEISLNDRGFFHSKINSLTGKPFSNFVIKRNDQRLLNECSA